MKHGSVNDCIAAGGIAIATVKLPFNARFVFLIYVYILIIAGISLNESETVGYSTRLSDKHTKNKTHAFIITIIYCIENYFPLPSLRSESCTTLRYNKL